MAFKPYTYMRLLLLLQWNTSQNLNPAASIPTLQSAVYESSKFWDQQLFQITTFRFWAVNLQNNVSSPFILPLQLQFKALHTANLPALVPSSFSSPKERVGHMIVT